MSTKLDHCRILRLQSCFCIRVCTTAEDQCSWKPIGEGVMDYFHTEPSTCAVKLISYTVVGCRKLDGLRDGGRSCLVGFLVQLLIWAARSLMRIPHQAI
jgi:hypothetical protein